MNYIGNQPAPPGMVLIGDTNPVGAIIWAHGVPDGSYLQLNGQMVSKVVYPDLWTYAQGFLTSDQTVNPGLYRSVDANTFALPKFDGLFIRATGQIDANHVAAALGVKQADTVQPHTHATTARYHTPDVNDGTGNAAASPTWGAITGVAANTGTTETRPANIALVPCVKALRTALIPASSLPVTQTVQLISSQVASNSPQLDFANLTGYTAYKFILDAVYPVNDGTQLISRISTNNGASFDTSGVYSTACSGIDIAGAGQTSNAQSISYMTFAPGNQSNASSVGLSGEILAMGLATAKFAMTSNVGHWYTASRWAHINGFNVASSAGLPVNAVRFLYNSGNIGGGRIHCYGIR